MSTLTQEYKEILQNKFDEIYPKLHLHGLKFVQPIENNIEYIWKFKIEDRLFNLSIDKLTKKIAFTIYLSYSEIELYDNDYNFEELRMIIGWGIDIKNLMLITPSTCGGDRWVKTNHGELHIRYLSIIRESIALVVNY